MSGISNSDLIDLQRTTLENLPNLDFEVALKYQRYNVVNEWFKNEKVQIDSGTSIKRNIMLDHTGNARHVRLYQKTGINVGDTQQQITSPWVQVQSHYSIERREALRNRKPAMFIELLKARRLDGMLSLAELLEERAWLTPTSSTDDLNPQGLPFWIVKAPTSSVADGGFIGQTVRYSGGTTSTVRGGLDSATYDRWRNWAGTYTAIDGQFVLRMRKAFYATKFSSPTLVTDLKDGPESKFKIYMGLDNLTQYEDLATKANDNLGSDLDKFHGVTTFKRVPILYTPQLDGVTDNPIYAVNHNKFYPITQDGDWMRESEPMQDVEQHNVTTTFIDGSYNFFCTNLRESGFVLSNSPTN